MEDSAKIFTLNLNHVYAELVYQFVNNKGKYSDSIYHLINWEYCLNSKNGMYFLNKIIIKIIVIKRKNNLI